MKKNAHWASERYVWMFVLFKDIFPKLFHPTMLCNWRLWLCRKRALAVLEIPRNKKNVVILGGIRTRDLWIRSPARYPLRYEDITLLHIIWLLILHLSSLLHGLFPLSLAFILSKLLLTTCRNRVWKLLENLGIFALSSSTVKII